ncbi:hypothetical protein M3J09_013869 [Ascochyta lentis]
MRRTLDAIVNNRFNPGQAVALVYIRRAHRTSTPFIIKLSDHLLLSHNSRSYEAIQGLQQHLLRGF